MDKMHHCMMYSRNGITSLSVVGHKWKLLLFLGDHCLPSMKRPSSKWRPPFWRIDAQAFANQPKISRLVWGLLKKKSYMTTCINESCLPNGFPGCYTPFEKQDKAIYSQALLVIYQENQFDFFNRLITQDKILVHAYDPETEAIKHYDSPPPKKTCIQL